MLFRLILSLKIGALILKAVICVDETTNMHGRNKMQVKEIGFAYVLRKLLLNHIISNVSYLSESYEKKCLSTGSVCEAFSNSNIIIAEGEVLFFISM